MTKVDCLKAVLWRAVWMIYVLLSGPIVFVCAATSTEEERDVDSTPLVSSLMEVENEIIAEINKLEKF